jgi:hypothetical protein
MVRSTIQRMGSTTKPLAWSSDDFDHQVWHDVGDRILEDRAGLGAVCEQLPQERELSEQGGQQQVPPSWS